MSTTLEKEFLRYDAAIFFETAAVGGISVEGGNPMRIESVDEALIIDKKLKELWSKHPRFIFIPHQPSFIKKVNLGLEALAQLVAEYRAENI
jgi:hypothetical protein